MEISSFFRQVKDKKGKLRSIELSKFRLFKVKRIFFVDFKKKINRGNHAHIKCRQFVICYNGKVKIKLFHKKIKEEIKLSSKSKGLYIKPKTWTILEPISKDCQIICLCDMKYLKTDYINNFSKFKKYSK